MFSFTRGGKHIIEPVVIAPEEELAVQDTQFVQPQMRETFALGRAKARQVLAGREGPATRLETDAEGRSRVPVCSASQTASPVVLLHDTVGQAKAEAPAALLCAEARPENLLVELRVNPLAGVGHVDDRV